MEFITYLIISSLYFSTNLVEHYNALMITNM